MLSTLAFDPSQPRDEQGQWTGGGFERVSATDATGSGLNSEWSVAHGEADGPFWNVTGEKNARYWTIRDDSGKLVAGATTISRGLMTEVKAIGSHAQGQGQKLLDEIKAKNVWVVALAVPTAIPFFTKSGFQKTDEAPGDYNVKWRRPAVRALSFPLPSATGARLLMLAAMRAGAFNPDQPRDERGQWTDGGISSAGEITQAHLDTRFPRVGASVDGRTVLDEVPNQDSIDSSLTDYERLPGIREVRMSELSLSKPKFYSVTEERRTQALADAIKASGEIKPLIVVFDGHKDGSVYILEGGHRYDALRLIEAKSFPAVVVIDTEELRVAASATNLIHAAADAHLAKLSVAIRYAFAMGRRAVGKGDASKAAKAVRTALLSVLPGTLLKVVAAGGEAGVELLRKMRVAEFDPDQPRDESGKWTSSESELASSLKLSTNYYQGVFYMNLETANAVLTKVLARRPLAAIVKTKRGFTVQDDSHSFGPDGWKYVRTLGGPGSGNFGHAGRPGEVGGSGDAVGAVFKVPENFRLEDAEYDVNTRFPLDKMVVASVGLDLLSIPYPTDWRVREMANAMKQGTKFPPITVEQYPDKLVIVDGNTRVAALKEMGIRGSVPAVIRLYGDGSPLPKGVTIDEKRTSSLRAPVKALGFRTAKPRDKALRMRFDVTNPAVVAWVKQHSAELVTQITDTSRERIRLAIEDLAEEGDFDLATDRIMAAVGDADRANLIARHEMMLAANEGQRQAWDQAVEKGLLPEDAQRTWIITPDEKVCPICEPLDGTTADLRGEYADGISGPPAHVQCRCTEGITELRAAEFNPDQPRDESGKWTSSGGGIILHGTAEELVSSILKDGLLASKAGTIFPDSKPGHVFLTTNEQLARVAAETAAERISGYSPSHPQFGQSGQLPAVLEVHVPANVLGKDKLLVDSYSHRGDIPGEWIKGVSIRTSAGWEKKDPSDYRGLEESRIFFVPWVFVTEAERI